MQKFKELWLDFETYSACDIEEQGGMAYALHSSTSMLCLGYAFDDQPAKIIRGIDDLPIDVELYIQDQGKVLAHNATFDYRIWNYVCTEQLGWPALSLDQVVDTMAVCLTFQIPAKLAEAGAALRVKHQKNPEGKKLIKMCCQPDARGKQPLPIGPLRPYFDRLFAYCMRDVESMRDIIRALPREHLIPKEHEIWKMTYEINTRGVPVDYKAIVSIRDYLSEYVTRTMAQVPVLTRGYVNTINQIAKVIEWCEMQGYTLDSLSADAVKKALKDDDCPDKVKELLRLRQELGRSSTAKYTKLAKLAVPHPDGNHYVYDNIQYHGAGPGRWAGRGFQIHNLPRASVPNPEEVITSFLNGDEIEDPVSKGKALIRPMIKAIDDHVLLVSDYSSIENRALHWHAEDYETLEEFAAGLDQYKTMAAARYKVTYDQVVKEQRQMGKVIILGCISEGTLVLTQNGVKPIEQVTLLDLLWDGENWVRHNGLLNKGFKSCISFNNVWLTPDHEIFISSKKEEVWLHEGNIQSENQAICLVIGKLLSSFPEMNLLNEMLVISLNVQSAETSIIKFWQVLKKVIQQSVESVVEKPNTSLDYKLIVSLRVLIKKLSIDLSIDGTQLKPDVLLQHLLSTKTTEAEVFKSVKNGQSLLKLLLIMLWDYQDLITQTLSSTESITTGTTNQEIYSSVQDQKIYSTEDLLKKQTKEKYLNTYDIYNVGPKQRFTVLTINGPMLVSNCGFGMGKDTFQETADVQFGMKLSIEESEAAVKAYRAKYPKVVDLWKDLKNGCARAVISGQRVVVNKVSFKIAKVKGRIWLCILLPSGKALYYLNPQVQQKYIPGYEHMGKVPTVTHEGMNPYSRKWGRLSLIPGRITENVVQGTAREIMAQGMLNVKKNMPFVYIMPSVHDELITMVHKRYVSDTLLEDFNRELCNIEWAPDLPLKAAGWIGDRYRKD